MPETFPAYVDVEYQDGADELPETYPSLRTKLDRAAAVTKTALEQYRDPALLWTGGKDSTLALRVARTVAEQTGLQTPTVVFIDHFQHFPEVHAFVDCWTEEWDLDLVVARNDSIAEHVADRGLKPGDEIVIDDLDDHNRWHARQILDYEEETFPFLLDTYVGNHLLKTFALNDALDEHGFDGVISGVRWDEQEARADETFFSPRHDENLYPPHDRVHPILPFTERDVWDALFSVVVPETVDSYPAGHVPEDRDDLPDAVGARSIPVSTLYFDGYRSIGSEHATERSGDEPAWLQDTDATAERGGRAQDKEDLMDRLRTFGYM